MFAIPISCLYLTRDIKVKVFGMSMLFSSMWSFAFMNPNLFCVHVTRECSERTHLEGYIQRAKWMTTKSHGLSFKDGSENYETPTPVMKH